jgi:hypothetical protein
MLRNYATTGLAFAAGAGWLAWWLLPAAPLREWKIKGPFGVLGASIDTEGQIALVDTSTHPISPIARERSCFFCCYGDSTAVYARCQLDLLSGKLEWLSEMSFGTRNFAEKENLQFHLANLRATHDFSDPLIDRWWMEWKRNVSEWTLRDADSKAIIARNQCIQKTYVSTPSYTPDRRWITISENRSTGDGSLAQSFIRRWLNFSASRENHYLLIFDPATGAKVNEVPSWSVRRWTPDGAHFWTVDTIHSFAGQPSGVTCRLWPARASGPPWWLVTLTIAAFVPLGRKAKSLLAKRRIHRLRAA